VIDGARMRLLLCNINQQNSRQVVMSQQNENNPRFQKIIRKIDPKKSTEKKIVFD